jgi:hypothetical protein
MTHGTFGSVEKANAFWHIFWCLREIESASKFFTVEELAGHFERNKPDCRVAALELVLEALRRSDAGHDPSKK